MTICCPYVVMGYLLSITQPYLLSRITEPKALKLSPPPTNVVRDVRSSTVF